MDYQVFQVIYIQSRFKYTYNIEMKKNDYIQSKLDGKFYT